jgi:hypothetical protein
MRSVDECPVLSALFIAFLLAFALEQDDALFIRFRLAHCLAAFRTQVAVAVVKTTVPVRVLAAHLIRVRDTGIHAVSLAIRR